MRYPQRRSDPVYWPAFADILTVVVVVLVCTLVSVLESKPPEPPGPVQGPKRAGVPSGKPEPTRDEYLASLREARAKCLATSIRKAGLALSMPLCRFDDSRDRACASEVAKLSENLRSLDPNELTRVSRLDLGIQLRAVTELNGGFGARAREALARGQEALRGIPLWSERLRDPTYQERPRVGAGALYFEITYRLQRTEQQEVERQWEDREYAALEQRRRRARSCETK